MALTEARLIHRIAICSCSRDKTHEHFGRVLEHDIAVEVWQEPARWSVFTLHALRQKDGTVRWKQVGQPAHHSSERLAVGSVLSHVEAVLNGRERAAQLLAQEARPCPAK